MKKEQDNYKDIFKSSGIILLAFIVNILLLTAILFFINIEITVFNVPIAFLITIIEFILFYRKRQSVKSIVGSIFLSILIIIIAIFLCRKNL